MLKRLLTVMLATAGVIAVAPSAWAGSMSLNFSDNGFSLSGNVTGSGSPWTLSSNGTISISFSGGPTLTDASYSTVQSSKTIIGEGITLTLDGVLPGSALEQDIFGNLKGWDDTVYSGAGVNPFDSRGALLMISLGGGKHDFLWISLQNGKVVGELFNGLGKYLGTSTYGDFNLAATANGLAATPEPSSLILLGTGLLLFALLIFGKERTKTNRRSAGTSVGAAV